MIKFYKVKDTEIRKVAEVNEDGSVKVIAIIGQVAEMLKREIIFPENTAGNEDKWLAIPKENPAAIREFGSLAEAKAAYTA